jgi:hypothetical protein
MTQVNDGGRAPLIAVRVRNCLVALVACVILIRLLSPQPSSFGFGTVLGIVAAGAILGYLVNVYLLSKALEPKASVAWLVLALQFLPILGVPIAISMIIKAGRLSPNMAHTDRQGS